MFLLQFGALLLLASRIDAARVVWCASTITSGSEICRASTSALTLDSPCTEEDILGYRMKAFTVPDGGTLRCVTMVRHLVTPTLEERWVYRGALDPEFFPTCESYCRLFLNLDFVIPPSMLRRLYVSCSDNGKNNEDLTSVVFGTSTGYNCSKEDNYAKPGAGIQPEAPVTTPLPFVSYTSPNPVVQLKDADPTSLPGWMLVGGIMQVVGMLVVLLLLVVGIVLYVGHKNAVAPSRNQWEMK